MLRNCIIIVLLFCAPLVVSAQEEAANVFFANAYRDINPGQGTAYREMIAEYVKPVQQARVDAGEIAGWTLYAVRFPAGGDYDTVSVTVGPGYAALEPAGSFRKAFDRVHSARKWDKFIAEIGPTNNLVRTEIWETLANEAPADGASNYLRVTYNKSSQGDGQAYNALVQKLAVPFWAEAVKSTPVNNWGHYALREPAGNASPHNFAAVVGFKSFADMDPGKQDFPGVFSKVHPNEDIRKVGPKFQKLTTPVRQETWELIDTTQPRGE
jgi:hypothetical protein